MGGLMYERDRVPDPAWVRDLEQVTPSDGRVNFLRLDWMAGDPIRPNVGSTESPIPGKETVDPIQRWVIRECVRDLDYVPPHIVEDLKGPDPRAADMGEWEYDKEGNVFRWYSLADVSREQQRVFAETGCWSTVVWVIQGSHGGHKLRFNIVEAGFLRELGLPGQPPLPGNLPYAEYNARVRDKLLEMDRLRQWDGAIAWDARSMDKTKAGLFVRNQRRADEAGFGAAMLKWLYGQVEDAVSDLSRQTVADLLIDAGRGDGRYNADEDAVERQFVEEITTQ